MIILIAVMLVFALALAALLWGTMIYNGLVSMRNNIDKAFSNIDVLLKQRYDEIPNLVEVCKTYMQHERQTLEQVAVARAEAGRGVRHEREFDQQTRVSDALGRLFMLVENYPDLKTDKVFLRLQNRITELEDQIADRRELYNETVTLYNTRIEQFPDVLIARPFNFIGRVLWQAEPEHRVTRAIRL
jgi:LemA protein